MAAIRAGVAVLVIGPTVTGGMAAAGRRGTVAGWVLADEPVGEGFMTACAPSWNVKFSDLVRWGDAYSSRYGCFPSTSLMPLDGEAEAITTAEPATVEASHV